MKEFFFFLFLQFDIMSAKKFNYLPESQYVLGCQ